MKTSKDEQLCGVLDPSLPYRIVRFDTLPSTNAYLLRLAREGENEGLVVVAAAQSEGKGRFSRVFYSPDGTGVYMSLLLRPAFAPEHFPLLTALAGTAAAEAAEAISQKTVGIKWVNDLYIGKKKICGILAESGTTDNAKSSLQNSRFVVLGIGINLYMPPSVPDALSDKMGALFDAKQPNPQMREGFIRTFLSRFHTYYTQMPETAFMDNYRRRSVLTGKRVFLHNAARDTAKEGKGELVTVLDIDKDGALLVADGAGNVRRVNAGEVTLSI